MSATTKRILQVVYCLGVGGSEMVAKDIALGLGRMGLYNAVCALEHGGPLEEELSRAGLPSFVAGRGRGGMPGAMYRLYRIMRRFRPDVVHTHHLYELFYAWPGALACGARIVHTEHEYFSLQNPRARFYLRALARLCRRITAVNRETASFIENLLGWREERVATIVNGIDLERFSKAVPDREALGVAPADKVLAVVARLEPVKGHSVLLEAFAQVLESMPEALLLVVGDGSARGELEARARELGVAGRVRFLGLRRDIHALLAASDAVVLASMEEGLPVSILEAMAASRPLVATAVGGVPSVVRDGETGFLVAPGDARALAGALGRVLGDEGLARQMGQNGFELVKGRYDAAAMVENYRAVYEAA
jgi:glycosyltransferase involved in cell wall biosynthesis